MNIKNEYLSIWVFEDFKKKYYDSECRISRSHRLSDREKVLNNFNNLNPPLLMFQTQRKKVRLSNQKKYFIKRIEKGSEKYGYLFEICLKL